VDNDNLTLNEELKLWLPENETPRKMLVPKENSEEVGYLCPLHNQERCGVCRSPEIARTAKIKEMTTGWTCLVDRQEMTIKLFGRNSLKSVNL
jgi:hypothetical protein